MQNYTEQYQTLEKVSEVACYEFLRKVETTPQLKTQALSVIRILGRDPVGSNPLFTKEGISVLLEIAFKPNQVKDTSSSREALKCIANCIHLNDKIKVYLEEQDVLGSCQYVLQSEDHISLDTQFLTCRILFFLTVNRPDLVTRLIDASISIAIEKVLTQNICILQDTTNLIDRNMPINPLTVTSEALKLLFNLLLVNSRSTEQENTNIEHFENCLVPIFHLLFQVPYSKPQPLVPPHSQAIHVLMQYPYRIISKVWQSQSDWTSKLYDSAEQSHTFIATTLVHLLDQAVHVLIPDGDPDNLNNSTQVDAILSPVCLVLRSLAEGEPLLSKAIAKKLLPNEKDRLLPVHEGFSLPAYMIRLMTSTMMPLTRDGVCEMLFVLCDKDANKFTQQVGYGNAIGYLVNKGIAMETPTADETEEKDINPITGQYVSSEKQPDLKDMTDEEKEREAERLFVLFERLKKTGIIDVENPIAKAMQESQGRFEEIDSSDED
ncbi:hypothetical protein INT48_000728 [Thamnidium elegans]|uniref:Synembryn-A n=1 Tax=Thamnidium elegans TaxID=101142 RepID=A0A8H7SYE1_9FUNG|nr:hypothetical protein INT48_000728 [Thamnidium elegans]